MRKRLVALTILGILAMIALTFPSVSQASSQTVDDEAQLFTAEQADALNQQAEALEKKIVGTVFIVTKNGLSDTIGNEGADYLLEHVGTDQNAIILLIDMGNRDYDIVTSGNMIDFISDERYNNILDDMIDTMKAGDYAGAAGVFLDKTYDYVQAGVPKGSYRYDTETGKITYYKSLTPSEILAAFVVAFAASGILFFVVRSRYRVKNKVKQHAYSLRTSMKLTNKDDQLVNSFVTTRRIPRNNGGGGGGKGGGNSGQSSTFSRGGGSFGGGGGGRSF